MKLRIEKYVTTHGEDATQLVRAALETWCWIWPDPNGCWGGDHVLYVVLHELCHARGFGLNPHGIHAPSLGLQIAERFDAIEQGKGLSPFAPLASRGIVRELADIAASWIAMRALGVRHDEAKSASSLKVLEPDVALRTIERAMKMPRQQRIAASAMRDLRVCLRRWRATRKG